MAPPFKVAEFDIMYGEGISVEGTLLDIAVNMDIIQKSGAWYSYNGSRISQGPGHFEDGVLSEQDEEDK